MTDVFPEFILLALVVVTALAFDFTNGFHDTANAMATSIATKALTPAAVTSAPSSTSSAHSCPSVAITVTNASSGSESRTLIDRGGAPAIW
ncbi:MAG: hypothetical protein KIT69_02045 [Propionibacteriaceae bacterium]|nr:hypothetical protein [Propionibacteriaceae bacterium]